jgi:transcriptional regulator with XRE-family HTH domain
MLYDDTRTRRLGLRAEEFIGQRIRDRREELAMTQEDLGLRVGNLLGRAWSRQTVSAAEKGRRAFTAAELLAIAHVLETRAPRLLTPPLELAEIELPGGAKLSTRTIADFGVTDKLLGDLHDDYVRAVTLANENNIRSWELVQAIKAIGDKVVTAIGAAEVATMHSEKKGPQS